MAEVVLIFLPVLLRSLSSCDDFAGLNAGWRAGKSGLLRLS